MMGFSCINTLLTSMLEKNIIIVTDIPVHHPQESQQPAKEINPVSDPIRCLAVMKLARSIFAA